MSKKIFSAFFLFFCSLLFFSLKLDRADAGYQLEGTGFNAFFDPNNGSPYKLEGNAFYAYTDGSQANSVQVYRFLNNFNGDHFYTSSVSEKDYLLNNLGTQYALEGTAFYAYDQQVAGTLPVYRFLNNFNGNHFYTISEAEKDYLSANNSSIFKLEGVAFYAYAESGQPNTLPVFRFLNTFDGNHFYTINATEKGLLEDAAKKKNYPVYRFKKNNSSDHFYTTSEFEKNYLQANRQAAFVYEGIAFYAYNEQITGTLPVYRFLDVSNGNHFYTISEDEKNSISNNTSGTYKLEGVAFYAFAGAAEKTGPVYRFLNTTTGDHFYTISEIEKTAVETAGLGPEISVGIWGPQRADVRTYPFEIKSDSPYQIKDSTGKIIAQMPAGTITKVGYDNLLLNLTGGLLDKYVPGEEVTFETPDRNNTSMLFDLYRSPDFSHAQYRGKFKFSYSSASQKVWAINILPLEQYVWGMGEIQGTGPMEYNKVMTVSFRTYGYYWLYEGTANISEGFIVNATPGNQLYKGYDYEVAHPRIREAALTTSGKIMTHPQSIFKNHVAITPYSSWTDGRTRSWQERWGSTNYPWCQSVPDPYGKDSTRTTAQLEADGNHMVGLSAHGALNLAGSNYNWSWENILSYYYTGISVMAEY